MKILSKGAQIKCEKGHVLGEALRDMDGSEVGTWGSAFGNWQHDYNVKTGQYLSPCPICGTDVHLPESEQ